MRRRTFRRRLCQIFFALLLISIAVFSCISNQPARLGIHLTKVDNSNFSWEEIFQKEALIDSFKILHTGQVLVPVDGILNSKKLPADHPFDEQIYLDVYSFLFRHKFKGWFLIDAGLDSTFRFEGNIYGPGAKKYIKNSIQEPGQNIAAQLKKERKKIEAIYFTHLHGDHLAGLPEIDKSIPKFVNKNEKYINIPFIYYSNHLNKSDTIYTLDFDQGFALDPLSSVIDIFGDSSFWGIDTPGHSSGHTSYLLITDGGSILLTGDVSHTKYGFINNIEPGWVENRKQAVNSLQQLRRFYKKYPKLKIIFGHEPGF